MLKKTLRLFKKTKLFNITTMIKCQQSPKLKTFKVRKNHHWDLVIFS